MRVFAYFDTLYICCPISSLQNQSSVFSDLVTLTYEHKQTHRQTDATENITFSVLRIVHIHGVKITKIKPPWHVLLDYFTTREFIKKSVCNFFYQVTREYRWSGYKIIKQNMPEGSDF